MKAVKLLVFWFMTSTLSFCTKSQSLPTTVEGKASKLMEQMEEDGFSGSVLLADEGGIILSQGYGLSNREEKSSAEAETLYDIGSIAKKVTKVAVLQLVEENTVSLDDSLKKFFPQLDESKSRVTIRQLLYHTSGLGEYHDTEGDFQEISKEEALQLILTKPLAFEPGTEIRYSNSGYTLLAAIVEKVSGKNFTEYVREEVLQPCGLTQTDFYQSQLWDETSVAIGYGGRTTEKVNSPFYWNLTWSLMGSGGLVSSTEEYHKWLNCLEDGEILEKETVQNHLNLYPTVAGSNDYGFHAISSERGDGTKIIVFSNSDADVTDVVQSIGEILDSVNTGADDGTLQKAIANRAKNLVSALGKDERELLNYTKQNISPKVLEQIKPEAITKEFSKVKVFLEGKPVLQEVLKIGPSMHSVILSGEESEKNLALIMITETEEPYRIKMFGMRPVDKEEESPMDANSENKWEMPVDDNHTQVVLDLFRALDQNSDDAIKTFINTKLGDEIRNDFPMEAHMDYLTMVRKRLGTNFKVEKVQKKGSDMKVSITAEDGTKYFLNSYSDADDIKKLGGLQLTKG